MQSCLAPGHTRWLESAMGWMEAKNEAQNKIYESYENSCAAFIHCEFLTQKNSMSKIAFKSFSHRQPASWQTALVIECLKSSGWQAYNVVVPSTGSDSASWQILPLAKFYYISLAKNAWIYDSLRWTHVALKHQVPKIQQWGKTWAAPIKLMQEINNTQESRFA